MITLQLPFASSIASQEYQLAEIALETAQAEGLSSMYIDCALENNSPYCWNKKRLMSFLESLEICAYKVKPIVHGKDNVPLTSKIKQLRKAAISYVKSEIVLAGKIGTSVILHAGQLHSTKMVHKARTEAIHILSDSLKELQLFATDHNVQIWIENLPGFNMCHPFYNIFSTYDEFAFILSEVPKINMLFDIGHANVGNTPYESFISKHKDRIAAICCSDNRGVHDSHAPLGMGTVKWKNILEEIYAVKWNGLVIFETNGAGPTHGINFIKEIYTDMMI